MNADKTTREIFIEDLRDALTHLYNADHLRKSPLIERFGLSQKFDASSALRKILADGIENFKPAPNEHDQSRAWRIYDSLFCCYVQQLSQQIVADQLSISDRQLRREQRAALEELADLLWKQYSLQASFASASAEANAGYLDSELAWVRQPGPDTVSDLKLQLNEVLNLTYPLSTQNFVHLKCEIPEGLPELSVHPVALNQILLNLILDAVHRTPGGVVQITAQRQEWSVNLQIESRRDDHSKFQAEGENPGNLSVAQQMTELSGARMRIQSGKPNHHDVHLRLPTREELPVLAIDDNADVLQLMQRFAAGSRFHILPVQDPDQVMALVERHNPRVILLDIMMPKDNGWMVLARLKQHPATANRPVVICTILPQENLALTLGAAGYLRKPFTREAFLKVLEQQAVWLESESGLYAG